jgi:hypothetical protein
MSKDQPFEITQELRHLAEENAESGALVMVFNDPTAGAPSRPWLTSAELHSSDASPRT